MFVFKQASKNLRFLGISNLVLLLLLILLLPLLPPGYFLLGAGLDLLFWLGMSFLVARTPGKGTSQIVLPGDDLITHSFHALQHWLLPLLQLAGFWATIYYLHYPLLQILLTLAQGLIGFVFLTNYRAYLNKSQKLELQTHYIYDLLTLITVFYANFAIFASGNYLGTPHVLMALASFMVMLLVFVADGLRLQPEQKTLLSVILLSILMVIYACFGLALITPIKTVIFLTLLSYLLLNYLHHRRALEHKQIAIVSEYILIIAITVIIVLQINI